MLPELLYEHTCKYTTLQESCSTSYIPYDPLINSLTSLAHAPWITYKAASSLLATKLLYKSYDALKRKN